VLHVLLCGNTSPAGPVFSLHTWFYRGRRQSTAFPSQPSSQQEIRPFFQRSRSKSTNLYGKSANAAVKLSNRVGGAGLEVRGFQATRPDASNSLAPAFDARRRARVEASESRNRVRSRMKEMHLHQSVALECHATYHVPLLGLHPLTYTAYLHVSLPNKKKHNKCHAPNASSWFTVPAMVADLLDNMSI